MSTRTPVIEVVDYNNGLSWRTSPDELEYWVKRLGLDEMRKQAHAQIDAALEQAIGLGIIPVEAKP